MDDFGAVLGTTAEQREAKDQYKKFSENLKQYILRELHNPEDITMLVRYLKDPTTVLNTSKETALLTEDEKYPIMVMIKNEEIKKQVTNINPTAKHNQYLCDTFGPVIPSTTERIGWRPIIYHQVTNI